MSNKNDTGAQQNNGNVLEKVAIALGLVTFLAIAFYQLHLPGLHYDEAKEAGLPALQLLLGLPVEAFRGAGIHLGERLIPLMVVDYIGTTNVILSLPFLAIGGVNVVALRALPVTLSALSLLLLYWFARELYSRRVAWVALLLLAVNPSFIFWSRQGIFVTSTIIPISLGAALCLARWYRGKSRWYLWLGMCLLGLGLYTKFIFLWIVFAFSVVFLLFEGRRFLSAIWRKQPVPRPYPFGTTEVIGSILAFLAGLFPLFLYNLQTNGTFAVISQNMTTSYYGTNNLAFLENLGTRLEQTRSVLNGNHFWYLGGISENPVWTYAVLAALLVTVLTVIFRAPGEIRQAAMPWLIWGSILLASCFTVSALWPTHYAIVTPWPPLALAVSFDLIWRHWHTPRWIRWLALAGLVLIATLDLRVDLAYHRALARTGGLGSHTSAIYDLAQTLNDQNLTAPAAMDWGMSAQIEFLTGGRIRPVEIFGYEWEADEGFRQRVSNFTNNPDSVYLFHAPAETVFARKDAFNDLIAEENKTSITEEVLHQPDGKAVFTLVRVKDKEN